MDDMNLLNLVCENIKNKQLNFKCLIQTNYHGEPFLRVWSSVCDKDLEVTPLLETLIFTDQENKINLKTMNFKREVLEEESFDLDDFADGSSVMPKYMKYLNDKMSEVKVVYCKGIEEQELDTKSAEFSILKCLIEKPRTRTGQFIFRSRQCKSLFRNTDGDNETNICSFCLQFLVSNQATIHSETEEGVIRKCPFPDCEKSFKRVKLLQNHLKHHHKLLPVKIMFQ